MEQALTLEAGKNSENIVTLIGMSTELVFFIHRLGIKVYRVKTDSSIVELADIPSLDSTEISKKLESYSGESIRLLTADTVSYLFHSQIDITNTPLGRDVVLEKIKSEIPENTESISWDYKLISKNDTTAEVIVFAPVVEFQKIIVAIANQLHLTIEAIEPESISITRHPNPIVGITLKEDIGERDEKSLNISVGSGEVRSYPKWIKTVLVVGCIIVFILVNYFLYQKYLQKTVGETITESSPKVTSTESIPTSSPSPTVALVKKFSDLKVHIQNGTLKSGYAGSIAAKFKENGVIEVTTSNADRDDYTVSKLSFVSLDIQKSHLSKFQEVFPIEPTNVQVDKSQSYDAILILGIN